MRELSETLERLRRRAQHGYGIDAPVPNCLHCHDRGWRIVEDGGAGCAVRCECQAKTRGERMLRSAGIPTKYLNCTFEQFKTSNTDNAIAQNLYRARKICEGFVEEFFDPKTHKIRPVGLLLIGKPGLGKTHLAVATLRRLVEEYGVKGLFVDISALFHELQSTFDGGSDDTRRAILRPVMRADCLVLDELGAQKSTAWVIDQLYLIINTRYNQKRPTIFTTNFRMGLEEDRRRFEKQKGVVRRISGDGLVTVSEEGAVERLNATEYLETRISEPLVSRLHEMAQVVEMQGIDYRKNVKQHSNRVRG